MIFPRRQFSLNVTSVIKDLRFCQLLTLSPAPCATAPPPQVNILYVAVTRAKRRLVVNTSLRAFLANTGAWDSVCLRGVAGRLPGEGGGGGGAAGGDAAESASSARCALCGGRADVGGGGGRLEGLTRAQAAAAAEEVGVRARSGRPCPLSYCSALVKLCYFYFFSRGVWYYCEGFEGHTAVFRQHRYSSVTVLISTP